MRIASIIDGLSVQVTLGDRDVDEERMLRTCLDLAEMQLGADLASERAVA